MSVNSVLAGYAFVKITMDDAELKRGLDKAQRNFKAFATGVNAWATHMATLAPLIAAPLTMSVRAFAAFDDRMRQVQAVTEATGAAFRRLTEEAKRLGRETSFTAAEVSEGMLALGRMGLNPQEIEAAILPMMNLARVTGTDLGVAAEIAANNMRVFGLDATKMTHVADILSVTANSSAQTLVDLGESLKMAGPHARRFGETITETSACLGILANMGIRGSLAGTALGKSYKRMADPKIIAYLKEYSVETLDSTGNLRKMRDILVDLSKAMKGMTNAEQITFAEEVFDARGSLGGGTLSINTDAIDQLTEKLKNAEGAAAEAAQKMDSGIGGAIRNLESAAEGLNLAFGEIISVTFLPLIRSASSLFLGLREVVGENSKLIGGMVQVTGAVVALGAGLKALFVGGNIVKYLISPLTALDAAISGSLKHTAVAERERVALAAAAEKTKTAAVEASNAKRIALESKRHMLEMRNAHQAASVVVAEESRKLAAVQARVNAEMVNNEKARLAYALQNGSTAGFKATPELMSAQKELSAQQQLTDAKIKNAQRAKASMQSATASYAANSAAARQAAAGTATFMTAQQIAQKRTVVYGAALGKLNTTKLFAAAFSRKHAETVLTASIVEMVASKKVVAAGTTRVALLYTEAIAAKVAAGAMIGFRTIMTAIAAHPIAIAIIAVTAALWGINKAFTSANQSARDFAEEQKKISERTQKQTESGDIKRQNSGIEFERLKQLEEISKRSKLSAEEIDEAEKLMRSLGSFGSQYWANLDETTGKLELLTDAQEQFNQKMAQSAQRNLESEISALEAERIALSAENEKLLSFWNHNLLAQISGRQDDSVKQIEANGQRIESVMKKIQAQKTRLQALNGGDKNAVTGKEGNQPTTKEKVDAETQKRIASEKEQEDAAKRLLEIEDESAKSKMSNLERELDGIRKVREEYKKYIDMLIAAEEVNFKKHQADADKNKNGKTQAQKDAYAKAVDGMAGSQKNIDSLKARQAAASKDFDGQEQKATAKNAAQRKKDQEPYRSFLNDMDSKNKEEQTRKSEDKKYSDAMQKKDYEGAAEMMAKLFKSQSAIMAAARADYNAKLLKAQSTDSEGGADLSENERAELDEMRKSIQEGNERMNAYREKIAEAQDAAQEAVSKTPEEKMTGSWNVSALDAMLGGGDAQERTAKATEESVRLTRESNKTLKKIEDNKINYGR